MLSRLVISLVLGAALVTSGCQKKTKPSDKGAAPGSMAEGPASDMDQMAADPQGPMSAAAACQQGARHDRPLDKEQYQLTVKAPAEAPVGTQATAEITVTPKAGYKYNLKYDTELIMKKTSPGVELARKKYEKAQLATLTKDKLVVKVAYTPKSVGKKVLHGELGFSVCTPKLCITEPDMCVAWETLAK